MGMLCPRLRRPIVGPSCNLSATVGGEPGGIGQIGRTIASDALTRDREMSSARIDLELSLAVIPMSPVSKILRPVRLGGFCRVRVGLFS
jgi:hypothetical protein